MRYQANLEPWTAEQLLAEALERTQDVPTLRLMEGLILRALLTAHDRAHAAVAAAGEPR